MRNWGGVSEGRTLGCFQGSCQGSPSTSSLQRATDQYSWALCTKPQLPARQEVSSMQYHINPYNHRALLVSSNLEILHMVGARKMDQLTKPLNTVFVSCFDLPLHQNI